jgi:hypothetical protein
VDSVNVTIQFAASKGYIAYQYYLNKLKKEIKLKISGSGNEINNHILLPENCHGVVSINVDGKPVIYDMARIENSQYTDFVIDLSSVHVAIIQYK